MTTVHKENLTKLSLEELEELHERQSNILKNKKIIAYLPDKGAQLQTNLKQVKKELELRRDIINIEENMQTLNINSKSSEGLKEKHIQHICNIEKTPKTERYKPFATLVTKERGQSEKPTQMISLVESMTLLTEQVNKLPFERPFKLVDEKEGENEEDCVYRAAEEQSESDEDDVQKST